MYVLRWYNEHWGMLLSEYTRHRWITHSHEFIHISFNSHKADLS